MKKLPCKRKLFLIQFLFKGTEYLGFKEIGYGKVEPVAQFFYCNNADILCFVIYDIIYSGLSNARNSRKLVYRYIVFLA